MTWAAAVSFLLHARAQDFSLPSPLGGSAPVGNPGTFADTEAPTPAPTPTPAPVQQPPQQAAPQPNTQSPAQPALQGDDKPSGKEPVRNPKDPRRLKPKSKSESKDTKDRQEPTEINVSKDSTKNAPTENKIPKTVIRGIIDGKLRFNPKEFSDLKKGQVLLVESKNAGEVAARVEVTAINNGRTSAAAKVVKPEAVKEASDLVGLTLWRESDFNTKYAQSDIAAVIAPKPILGRNHLIAMHLNFVAATSSAANVMTGLDLNQETQSFAVGLEGFLPEDMPKFLDNKLGVRLSYAQSLPSTVVGRVASTDETQTFKLTTNEIKAALIYKSRAKSGSLSQWWGTLGYTMSNTNAAWETNVGSGNTELSLSLQGLEFGLGGDFSPLPFLYLGADFVAGIPQKWTSKDSGNSVGREGSWSMYLPSAYTELRYPMGAAKKDLFTLQVKGGLSIDQVQTSSSASAKKENFTTPVFLVGVGYFTK